MGRVLNWLRGHGRFLPPKPSVIYWGSGELPTGATALSDGFILLPPTRELDIVLSGPPGPDCRFIEIEMAGHSVRIGHLIERPDGLVALRVGGGA